MRVFSLEPAFASPSPVLRAQHRQAPSIVLRTLHRCPIACAPAPLPPRSTPPFPPQDPSRDAKAAALRTAAGLRRNAQRVQATIRSARTQYRDADNESRRLASCEHDAVLGEDLSSTPLGSRASVQDLSIPPAPPVVDLKPARVIELLCAHVDAVRPNTATDVRSALSALLASLQLCIIGLADRANPLFYDDDKSNADPMINASAAGQASAESVDALLTLLELGRFNSERPAPLSPPALESLPVKVSVDNRMDMSIFSSSSVDRPLLRQCGRKQETDGAVSLPEHFPSVLLVFRGTGVRRQSGLCLPAKIRAIEEYYLGWLRSPVVAARKLVSPLAPGLLGEPGDLDTNVAGGDGSPPVAKVRRVYPVRDLSPAAALTNFMLPTFTQEPIHRLCVCAYREFTPDRDLTRALRKEEALNAAISAAERAIDPASFVRKSTREEGTVVPMHTLQDHAPGTFKKFRLEVFADVPWGNTPHILPSVAVSVVANIRDLLRVDLLTLVGITSCIWTAFRDVHSPRLVFSVVGTLVVYAVRIGMGLRSALMTTHKRLLAEKGDSFVAANEGAIALLSLLAIEQQFALAAAVYVSRIVGCKAQAVERDVYGLKISSAFENIHDADASAWSQRLVKWGYLDNSGSVVHSDFDERVMPWD
jgi:Protein of unknown function (DUF3754)